MTIRGAAPGRDGRRTTDVVLHSAGRMGEHPVPVLRIVAAEEFPLDLPPYEGRALHAREGRELAEALWNHLAGGTVDQLLVALLDRKATELRVTG